MYKFHSALSKLKKLEMMSGNVRITKMTFFFLRFIFFNFFLFFCRGGIRLFFGFELLLVSSNSGINFSGFFQILKNLEMDMCEEGVFVLHVQ